MTSPAENCVVDASVAIKIFLNEPYSDQADALFAKLTLNQPAELIVPELFYAECANIFWKYVNRAALPVANAKQSLEDLTKLNLTTIPLSDLVSPALDLAVKYRISAYDACYLAAAEKCQVPLVTADERLVQKLQGSPFDVQWLGNRT